MRAMESASGRARRAFPFVAVVLILTTCGGGATAPSASPSPSLNAKGLPGVFVDVGGYKLWFQCEGTGSPTLIMESGNASGDHSPDVWFRVAPTFETTNRVCFYDRAGNGWSDRRPERHITVGQMASELDAVLSKEGIEPPYVFVAHSFGAMDARAFALAHPGEVVAMVLVDALYGGPLRTQEGDGGSGVDTSGLDGRGFGQMPLAVVSSEDPAYWGGDLELHTQHQDHLATLSSNVTHVISVTCGLYVMYDEPSLVIEAIHEVLLAVGSGSALPPCQQSFPTLGGECAG